MTHDSDILIVGGGLNGPALALAAAQAGLSATVIDAQPAEAMARDGFDGRSYALAISSVRMLRALGVWGAVGERAQPMRAIKVSDGRAGEGPLVPYMLHFDHAEIEEGPMGHMLEDRHLRRALHEAMASSNRITVMNGETVVAQAAGAQGVTVTLGSGQVLRGRLLVGADGRASGTAVRAGIGRGGRDYGQTALVCAIEHALPHDGVAHQFFMPPGPLAILPLPGNRSSIVWSETQETAERFMALDDAGFLEVLRPRFGGFLGEIALAGQRYSYPLTLTVANRMTDVRLALVGDAAHGLHPIAGQGLNAGFRDVAVLAQVMAEARMRGEDIGTAPVLARYAAWRRFDVTTLALTTDLTNRLFSNDNPLLRVARGLGMGIVNAIPQVRRGLMREAAGLTGDLPDLMRD